MSAFKSIVVPTDFGEAANGAIDLAIELGAKFGSKLTLVHAFTLPVTDGAYGAGLSWPIDDLAAAAKTELDCTLRRVRERYPAAEGFVVCGDPCSQILDAIETSGADLVVMGTHGRRGLSRVFLGSVAEKVVRLSPVPVVTVSGNEARRAKEKVIAATAQPTI